MAEVHCTVPYNSEVSFTVNPEDFRGEDLDTIVVALRDIAEQESRGWVLGEDVEEYAHEILEQLNEPG